MQGHFLLERSALAFLFIEEVQKSAIFIIMPEENPSATRF